MFYLLPESEKKIILVEYKLRRTIIMLLFLSATCTISAVFLLPSYIISSAKDDEVMEKVDAVTTSTILQEGNELNARLSQTNLKLEALRPSMAGLSVDAVHLVLVHKKPGIQLTGFAYRKGEKETAQLSVSGMASTRDVLLEFVKELKAENAFSDVQLPVSNFAKDKNIEFNLEVTGYF